MKVEFTGNRRSFIKTAALLGGIVALLGTGRSSAAKAEISPPRPEKSGQGYRLTEHIKKYYQTLRL